MAELKVYSWQQQSLIADQKEWKVPVGQEMEGKPDGEYKRTPNKDCASIAKKFVLQVV